VFYDASELARSSSLGSHSRSGSLEDASSLSHNGFQADGKPQTRAEEAEQDPEWLKRELPGPRRRDRLPPPAQQEKSVSLWSIIKECVGKDLSRICLPVYFNEPLSALQRIAEELEYSELLDLVGPILC
jgi:hypothetical protein